MAKAAAEVASGRAELVCTLPPARMDTSWWRDATAAASLVRILPGRVKFGEQPAPFPSAVIVFGDLPGRHGSRPQWRAVCRRVFWPAYAGRSTCSERCGKPDTARGCPRFALRNRDRRGVLRGD